MRYDSFGVPDRVEQTSVYDLSAGFPLPIPDAIPLVTAMTADETDSSFQSLQADEDKHRNQSTAIKMRSR
jgi:hypothetical protein